MIEVEQVAPYKDKALVRLVEKSLLEKREFTVIRQTYEYGNDWELAVVEALGEGDWEPVAVGDHVIVQAHLGGKAGSDISGSLGERRETHVIVDRQEVVSQVIL